MTLRPNARHSDTHNVDIDTPPVDRHPAAFDQKPMANEADPTRGIRESRPRHESAVDAVVVLGSSLTALAVVRDAAAHALRTVAVDWEPGPALQSRWPTRIFLGSGDAEPTLEKLLSLGGPRTALIGTSDRWLRFIHDHRRQFEDAYSAVLHPRNDALDICLDKLAFARWCAANGLPTPLTWLGSVEPTPAAAKFPFLIRPAHTLHGSRDVVLPKAIEVRDAIELDAWMTRYRELDVPALVSESLLRRDLEQWSVGLARRDPDMLAFTAIKVRPSAERCAVGSFVELRNDPAVEALGRAAAEALAFHGVGEIEILRDRRTSEPFIIEINARPWLQYSLAPASGHDFIQLLLGSPSTRPRSVVRTGKAWVNFHDDLFNAFSRSVGSVRNGRETLWEYAASALRGNVYAVLDTRDPAPFLNSLRTLVR